MKVNGKLYLIGNTADLLPTFLNASDEERGQMLHFYAGEFDMSDCWTLVGDFEAEVSLHALDLNALKNLRAKAVAGIDAQVQDLDRKYFLAKQELENRRANLLCLEAPSND